MYITVKTQGFELSNALNDFSDSKVRLALGRYRAKIQRADIFLTDINGPKGGMDMRCKMKIKIDGQPSIVVQETSEDMYEAISICSHRVKRTLARKLAREDRRRVKMQFTSASVN